MFTDNVHESNVDTTLSFTLNLKTITNDEEQNSTIAYSQKASISSTISTNIESQNEVSTELKNSESKLVKKTPKLSVSIPTKTICKSRKAKNDKKASKKEKRIYIKTDIVKK